MNNPQGKGSDPETGEARSADPEQSRTVDWFANDLNDLNNLQYAYSSPYPNLTGRLDDSNSYNQRAIPGTSPNMNASMHQYPRSGPVPVQRSPHAAARPQRGIGPMMSSATPRYNPDQAQQHKAQMEADMNARKARAPTDLNLPEGIEETVIGDGVQQYKALQEFERKLDATMMRMRLQLQDNVFRRPKYYRTLRIFMWNTVKDQPWQISDLDENAFDFSTGLQATYKIFINGRLLPDEDPIDGGSDEDSDLENDSPAAGREAEKNAMETDEKQSSRAEKKAAAEQKAAEDSDKPSPIHSKTRLSHFFKAITVDMHRDPNLQPDGVTALEWKKPPPQPNAQTLTEDADFDILHFERKSDENINCTVNFYLDEEPERYLLTPELARVCDEKTDDRTTVMWKLWEYIKMFGLLQDEEKKTVSCDEILRAVCSHLLTFFNINALSNLLTILIDQIFKCDTLTFPQMANYIQQHMSPLPPVSCRYTIRVDPDYAAIPSPGNCSIYDIRVSCPPPLPDMPYLNGPLAIQTMKDIRAKNEHIALLVQKMQASMAKHKFLKSFSEDPANFMKKWMASQRRDMEVILGDRWGGEEGGTMGGTEFRRGGTDGIWGSEKVKEAVGLMVSKEGKRN